MHFDPLRPNRVYGPADRYEFAHGTNSLCVYEIESLDFVKEIPVGERPDCHGTSVDNRYVYIACADGLHCIDQDTLEVVKVVDTGHVFAVNVMPDGSTMLLHDAFGAILVLKDIQDMARIHVHKRLQMQTQGTVGGKGHFIGDGRYYLVNGWDEPRIYTVDLENDYANELFLEDASMLHLPDDLVLTSDKTRAYSACYHAESYVAVTDITARKVIGKIRTGCGSCGLTMTNDERYVVASNDQDDSISVIDTTVDQVIATHSARAGFERLGTTGLIQGISVGRDDSIYVYGCSGTGAIVRFRDVASSGEWTISYPGGNVSSR